MPIVRTSPRRTRSDASRQQAPPAKRTRCTAGPRKTQTSLSEEIPPYRHVGNMPTCSPRLHQGVHAVTNSVTSDDHVPDMFASSATTSVSTQSEQEGCVEGVGERNPSQLEEFKWLKRRLGKLMAQQAKLVQRRTALRKVSRLYSVPHARSRVGLGH